MLCVRGAGTFGKPGCFWKHNRWDVPGSAGDQQQREAGLALQRLRGCNTAAWSQSFQASALPGDRGASQGRPPAVTQVFCHTQEDASVCNFLCRKTFWLGEGGEDLALHIPACPIRAPGWDSQLQLPARTNLGSSNGSKNLVPAILLGDQDGIPCSKLCLDPARLAHCRHLQNESADGCSRCVPTYLLLTLINYNEKNNWHTLSLPPIGQPYLWLAR